MGTSKVLAVVAISHQRAPMAILEQVNLDTEGCARLANTLMQCQGVTEAVVLSTCNRTEMYLAGSQPDVRAALGALVDQTGGTLEVLDEHVRHATGENVALHLFRIAAGLESRVSGEREILGQVRSAITGAREAGTVGSHLECLFRSAIAVGRQAQQTDGSAPSLLPQIGLDAARRASTKADGLTVVMGAGMMAAATVAELGARGMDFVVCARRHERAALLVSRPEQVVSFEDLPLVLDRAEVVVCATAARTPLLSVADVELAMARRGGRPLVIVDLSLPRNVDPAAGAVPGIRLLDLEDLVSGSSVVELRRRTEIIDDEFRRYKSWLTGQVAGHMIAVLHAGIHALCQETLVASLADSDVGPEAIAAASRGMAGKLLHTPTLAIKALMAKGDETGARAVLTSYGIVAGSPTCDVDEQPSGSDINEDRIVGTSSRNVRLVARSGRRRDEIGRVRILQGASTPIAS
jgi:glutamyl-tRNA reductase